MFYEQPVRLVGPLISSAHARKDPASFQLRSVELKLEVALFKPGLDVYQRLPSAEIPQHHSPAAVLAFRNGAFEASVLERMVFDLHCETLVAGIEARAFGDGPAFENPIPSKPKIVVEAG